MAGTYTKDRVRHELNSWETLALDILKVRVIASRVRELFFIEMSWMCTYFTNEKKSGKKQISAQRKNLEETLVTGVLSTKVNFVFHPFRVNKLSTSYALELM